MRYPANAQVLKAALEREPDSRAKVRRSPQPEPSALSHPERFAQLPWGSYEEEAKFWDTHDATDYIDEPGPVKVRVAKPLSHGILIDLDSETFRALCALGHRKRVNPINMAKRWIIARLKEETEGK